MAAFVKVGIDHVHRFITKAANWWWIFSLFNYQLLIKTVDLNTSGLNVSFTVKLCNRYTNRISSDWKCRWNWKKRWWIVNCVRYYPVVGWPRWMRGWFDKRTAVFRLGRSSNAILRSYVAVPRATLPMPRRHSICASSAPNKLADISRAALLSCLEINIKSFLLQKSNVQWIIIPFGFGANFIYSSVNLIRHWNWILVQLKNASKRVWWFKVEFNQEFSMDWMESVWFSLLLTCISSVLHSANLCSLQMSNRMRKIIQSFNWFKWSTVFEITWVNLTS